ncbi:IS110 family transposase [Enterocloster clostridioformis]|uniref:IS110 family transposase n=1 Tax=Enterocloster clostridioformis TaxID=1531 RepID=UPI001570AAE0|nr:IS110 family transposase [Enterocloster clostridioformis]NSJ57455.1 IS110 family transposase [Enterocloster clostridioformis]
MKVSYQTCCGVDVHKSFLVATIVKNTGGIEPSYQKKRFSTFNNSILEFKQWLLDNDCHDVCMESTGKYWVPVFNLLEDDINVVIANPKWVKAVKGNKDDTKDSKWIGDLFRLGLVRGSYVPCKKIRILREYTRYRYKLISCRSSEKNRYQNALTVCNVALDSVVSDIFGKSSTSIIDYLLEQSGTSINHEEIASKLLRSLKSKEDAVIESVEGYQMTDAQKYRMRLVRAHMDYITAEIGTDMSQFSSSKRLCCWAGLTPGSNESAGKKKSVRITRAGVYLKPALVQCAHAAVKSDKSPYYKKKYDSLVKRRGKKRAIIAIARMILTAIYQMMSTGEQWNPSDLYKIDMPVALVEKQKAKAIKQAKKLLQREGLLPPDEPLAS